MRAYSQDIRDRVLRALARGEGPSAVARRYEVSRLWVYRVRKRWEEQGQRQSLPTGGNKRSRIAHKQMQIRRWIRAEPGLTLAAICGRLAEEGIQIKVPALWHQLHKWGMVFRRAAVMHGRTTGAGWVER